MPDIDEGEFIEDKYFVCRIERIERKMLGKGVLEGQIQTTEELKGLEVNQVEVENQLEAAKAATLSCGGRCRSTTGGELEEERQEAIGIITGAHGRERGNGLPIVHSPGTSQSNPWHMKGPCRVLTMIRLVCDQEQDHGD
jgi:hypothetical protein